MLKNFNIWNRKNEKTAMLTAAMTRPTFLHQGQGASFMPFWVE